MVQDLHPQDAPDSSPIAQVPRRIAVGVDGSSTGDDAAVPGAALAQAAEAELILVAVHPDPIAVLPPELDWKGVHEQAHRILAKTRRTLAPPGRTSGETDSSAARALARVVQRELRRARPRLQAQGRGTAGDDRLRDVVRCSATRPTTSRSVLTDYLATGLRPIWGESRSATTEARIRRYAGALALRTGAALQWWAGRRPARLAWVWGGLQLREAVELWNEVLEEMRGSSAMLRSRPALLCRAVQVRP